MLAFVHSRFRTRPLAASGSHRRPTPRVVVVATVAVTTIFVGYAALTVSAADAAESARIAQLQSFIVPASAATATPVRDAFVISAYTVVQWPVPSSTEMSSGFGYRSCVGCSSDHLGIDLNPGAGFPIQAIAQGTVVVATESLSGLGVEVVLEHNVDGEVVRSLYGHMQLGSLTVHVGDTVSAGQVLGLVGSTGASTGPHLHFGILRDGIEIDPQQWLAEHANS